MPDKVPHVVILGGGFGGLEAAKRLGNARVRVTLVDKTNHHLFQPLLYQVATAGLSAVEIASPIRAILRGFKNITVLMAEVESIELPKNTVHLNDLDLEYDYLVIGLGSGNSYFGHDEWAKYTYGLKDLKDAFDIRYDVLAAFEEAEKEGMSGKEGNLTFAIVGGGPTGVELAGSLAELRRFVLAQDFRNIDPSKAKIIVIEGAHRLLPVYPEKLSLRAEEDLHKLGVEIVRGFVTNINEEGIQVGDRFIPCVTKLWCAGVAASPVTRNLGVELDKMGRIKVQADLSVADFPNVFAVGDIACITQADGKTVPGLAPAAMQEGRFAAEAIIDRINGKPASKFVYADKGMLATIGRSKAVASLGKFCFGGVTAWWLWLGVHVFSLIGFRNRLMVLLDWCWSYMTFHRGARLLVPETVFKNDSGGTVFGVKPKLEVASSKDKSSSPATTSGFDKPKAAATTDGSTPKEASKTTATKDGTANG